MMLLEDKRSEAAKRFDREMLRIKQHSYRTTNVKMSPPENVKMKERQL